MFGRGANKSTLNEGNPVGISLLLVIISASIVAQAITGGFFGIEPIWNENKISQSFIETSDFSHNETYDSLDTL